jgi:hypothetical protein
MADHPAAPIPKSKDIAVFALAVLCGVAAPARAEERPKLAALSDAALDIDRDGRMDRAALVLVGGSGSAGPGGQYRLSSDERVDLYVYLDAGDGAPDLSRPPSFIKKYIADPERAWIVFPLEIRGRASLAVTTCYGCGANKSWEETLTIAYRRGEFLAAGYTMDWDWNSRLMNGTVETKLGGCDINFLSGKGAASQGLDEGKPLKTKFKRIRLADWSSERRPEACRF